MMVATQNDPICLIDKPRDFAQRLKENNVPLLYLEDTQGTGHSNEYSNFQFILDFFEGTFGDKHPHEIPTKYDVKVDTVKFSA